MEIQKYKAMSQLSWLECMRCKRKLDLLPERYFICPDCVELLDVCHDFSVFDEDRASRVDALKREFDERCKPVPGAVCTNSGVWRFRELIMPSLLPDEIVSLGEGVFPILEAGPNIRRWVGGDLKIHILPEGMNPTGSFKDQGGTVAVSIAKKSGVGAVACASTGDTSAMAAAYAAAAGLGCVVVLPKGQVTDVQLSQPLAHGATTVLIPGSFDDCMRVVREWIDQGLVYPINSINPCRIEGHQSSVFLMAQYLGWELPDFFFVPVGNGSNTSSIGKGVRLLNQLGFVEKGSKIVAVQSSAASPLARSWESLQDLGVPVIQEYWEKIFLPQEVLGETTATASRIGNPVSRRKVMREICHHGGAVLEVGEAELNEAVMVAGQDGIFVCPQTGIVLAGIRHGVESGLVPRGSRLAVVSTATGLKFPGVPVKYGTARVLESLTCRAEDVAAVVGL